MSHKNSLRDFDLIIRELRKLYTEAIDGSKSLSSSQRIQLEYLWTDYLSKLITCGNSDMLENFSYGLEMQTKEEESANERRRTKAI